MICIDQTISNKCWNTYDSFGEICVYCGCCAKDPKQRCEARLNLSERMLKLNEEHLNDKSFTDLERENIRIDIQYWKRRIAYYKKRKEQVDG